VCYIVSMRLPRPLTALATLALLLGGYGGARALVEQVLPYVGSQEGYVSAARRELEMRNALAQPEVPSDVIARAGDRLGEKGWTRRGINLPLGLVNLVLSAMLFAGALRALARSPWGHGAWSFSARLSIPYTIVAAVVAFVEARDGWEANAALFTNLSLQTNMTVETLADFELLRERIFAVGGAAISLAFYAACWIYLRRPSVRALFVETEEEE
jgi:hypothetical protein